MPNERLNIFAEKMFNFIKEVKDLSIILVDIDFADIIVELNKEQIFKSEQITGELIERTYSKATEQITQGVKYRYAGLTKEKKQGENFFLYDTGKFFNTFKVKANKDGFKIIADTKKPDKDLSEFGQLIGLQEKNIESFTKDLLIPEILRYLQYNYFK